MDRTAEQVAADDALTAALQNVFRAYADEGEDPDLYLLTDYVVVSAGTRFDDAGTSWSRVSMTYRDSDVPAYRAMGLLSFALARCQAYVQSDED
jgi:hypothetical protein